MFNKDNKINLNEGRIITGNFITYGGFPRILEEAKKAKKDYDGDDKLESAKDEYFGSKDKAIKKAMGKKSIKEYYDSDEVDIVEELLESVFDDEDLELIEAILMEKKEKKWIQKAIKKEGSLRKSLKTKSGKNIPVAKLEKAAKKGGKMGKRARLALTLRKLNEQTEGEGNWEHFIGLVNTAKKEYFNTLPGTPGKRMMPSNVSKMLDSFTNDPSEAGDNVTDDLIQAGFPAEHIANAAKIRKASINQQKSSMGKLDPDFVMGRTAIGPGGQKVAPGGWTGD